MTGKLSRMLRDEQGITALETAIILIAFVVVAAVFAFTILSAGTYSTEQSREAVYAGLEEVQGSLETRGSVIANGNTVSDTVTSVVFSVANVAGGEPVDFNETNKVVVVEYRDSAMRQADATWTGSFIGDNDGDTLLEEREILELTITIPITAGASGNGLTTNETFVIEVKPPQGSPLYIQRTVPSNIDTIMDLH